MHRAIYEDLDIPVIAVDTASESMARWKLPTRWEDLIVDICTPTATHVESLRWAYQRGARHFIVEEPCAESGEEWRRQLSTMPAARIFVIHNYLHSSAFRIGIHEVGEITRIWTEFNRQRGVDDSEGRGAANGRLPHLMQVEAPQQLAMLHAIAPSLKIADVAVSRYGMRRQNEMGPISGSVVLTSATVEHAEVRTSVRADSQRTLFMANDVGQYVQCQFPTSRDLHVTVLRGRGSDEPEIVFSGRDDMVHRTLITALDSFRSGFIPLEASAGFASIVLDSIDEARWRMDHEVRRAFHAGERLDAAEQLQLPWLALSAK
jgi:hypothetical protein